MSATTSIEWTQATWNPFSGCTKVSPGCAHCYAERLTERWGRDFSKVVRASERVFNSPLHWKKPRLVFACSMSDWFHEDADQWRDEAWDIVRRTPHHTYQILTKRPERIREHLPTDWGDGYRNVWLGTSVENQRFAGRVASLLNVPGRVHFVSAEPLLGPIDLTRVRFSPSIWFSENHVLREVNPMVELNALAGTFVTELGIEYAFSRRLSWIIAGGESGPGYRPMRLEWARSLREQCRDAGVAFFMKQDSGPRPGMRGNIPDDLWLKEMPQVPA